MAWIIIEGLDRAGKTTVAELYKKQGYEVVHFSAPNKKYSQPGYAGPSYLDEILDIYQQLTGKDVVFDRSAYGELIWPKVYGREPQLNIEDLDVLRDFERQNETKYILMHDPDMAGHWKRCIANKEPLDREQFKKASGLFFSELNSKYGFALQTLKDYNIHFALDEETRKKQEELAKVSTTVIAKDENGLTTQTTIIDETKKNITVNNKSPEQARLEKANAINDVLSKKIVKGKGQIYSDIENSIRTFLNNELGKILGQNNDKALSAQEIEFIKALVKRAHEKENSNGKRI
jgi:thymidylate kinase